MFGDLKMPLDVVAVRRGGKVRLVGPRRRFEGLPDEILIATAGSATVSFNASGNAVVTTGVF